MSKGNTMDDFIVQLGWNDKKAIAGLKAFMKKEMQANKEMAKNRSKAQATEQRALADVRKRQQKAELKSGIEADNLRKRAKITSEREVISERQRMNKAERKRDLDADKARHKAQVQQARKLDERNARKRQTSNFANSDGIRTLRAESPERARAMVRQYHRELTKGTKTSQKAVLGINADLKRQVSLIRRLQSESRRLNSVQRGMGDSMNHLVRSYASIFAVISGVGFINRTGQGFESINSSMLAAMGNQAQATEQIQFLDRMTDRLGISLLDTADSYAKFAFSSQGKMPIEEVQDLFTGISELGTVLGITKDRMKLSMNAITQIT